TATAAPAASTVDRLELLSRLRMPGQGGSKVIAAPVSRLVPPQPGSIPAPQRAPLAGTSSGRFAAIPAGRDDNLPVRPEHAGSEIGRLRSENKELRQLLNEMKQLLQEASDTEQSHAKQNVDLQTVLAEKTKQVEELTDHLHHFEEQISSGALAPVQPQRTK